MNSPNLNVNNITMSSQQIQQSQRHTSSRNVNYANVTSKDSFPKRDQAIIIESLENVNIEVYLDALSSLVPPTAIRFISRIAQNRICMYLESSQLVEDLVERKCKLTINNRELPIRSLVVKNKRIVLSNVCPTIPHYTVEQELRKMGVEPMSPITYLRSGTANPKYAHVLSFRRQVFVSPTDEKKLPEKFQLNFEDINYWIYPTCDSLKCFLCKELGHLAKNCPINTRDTHQNTESVGATSLHTTNIQSQLQTNLESLIEDQTHNETQELPTTSDVTIDPTQMKINLQDLFVVPTVNDPEFPKRAHPPTTSTISSLDVLEKELDMETEPEDYSESIASEESDSPSKIDITNTQLPKKSIAKKRKLAEKQEFYNAAWNNVKEKVEAQVPPANHVLSADQLRHLIESTKGKEAIKDTVKQYSDNQSPLCLCLQETNFNKDHCANLNGYLKYFKNRVEANRASGGVAIFVKSHAIPEEIQLTTNLEAVAVRLKYPINISLCNIYIPNSKTLETEELTRIINQLPIPFILLGDFNSHHEYWGSDRQDPRGNLIANWLDSNEDLILCNTGQPTHFCTRSGRTSSIDLTIVDKIIAPAVRWVALEDTYDSDHFPIVTMLLSPDDCPSPVLVEKFIYSKADWPSYQSKVDELLQKLPEINLRGEIPVDEITAEFSSLILEAANLSIPKTNGKRKKKQVYWWNEDCKKAVLEQKKAFRMYKKNAHSDQSAQLRIEFMKKRAIARRTLKESRRSSWREFVSSINNQTPVTEVWNKIHCLNTNKKKALSTIVLEKEDGNHTANPIETADMLAASFAANSSSSNYDEKFLDLRKNEEINSLFDTQDNSQTFNGELSMHELTRELAKLRNSSPGPDQIPNILIKNLPVRGLCYLLDLFNLIWIKQQFPQKWKEAIIVPILKPNKIPSNCKSYRPIALTCNISKLMEKILSKRLKWYAEANNIISPQQYGFRQFRSTQDHLANFVTQICDAFIDNQFLLAASLDIEKAYEMAWAHRILRILEKKNIRGNMLAYIKNFLTDRRIQVRVDHTLSESRIVENGFPQGAVLSVILFLIDINDVIDHISSPVKGNLFADDLIVHCRGKNLNHTSHLVQKTLDSLQKWKRINLLKVISSTKWGADKYSMLLTYRATIRSKMDYGSSLYDTAAGHRLNELNSIHNLALRLSIGAFRTSPINSTLAEAEEMPLYLRRKEILLNFMNRAQAQTGDPAFDYTKKNPVTDLEYRLKSKSLKPPRVRYSDELDKLNIIVPSFLPRRQGISPPWKSPNAHIDLELAERQKNTTPDQTYRSYFQAVMEKYTNYTCFYTDGSVKKERTSCAVVFSNTKLDFRLQNFNSIFTCEATAISQALSIAIDKPDLGHIAIFTDSRSCLSAISNIINTNPIILNIQEKIHSLNDNNRLVKLIWIPSHRGIPGNEEADKVAKEAIDNLAINYSIATTATEFKKHIKNSIRDQWKEEWEKWARKNAPKLAEVRDSHYDPNPVDTFCRRDQVTLTRLRIGHTKLTHSYLMSKEPKNNCNFCNMELTVKHILFECQSLVPIRNKIQLPNTIKDCLNSTRGCYKTLKFLKEIKIINEI
ncbi:uncharacterized protein LOC123273332 [Cotesia glomerata]|uniref:uncharacterized protein LOC123273332 n=1 Tax=Cotesia glomerata TaxID=32391 RepID=UPI001D005F2F|nr:uncharacterized protein LOC123273332 [Cotesia glomerata]